MIQKTDQKKSTRQIIADFVNTKAYDKAEPVILQVLATDPDCVWALTAMGVVCRATKRPTAAEACYKRALLLEPDNPEICSNYGNLLVDLDRIKDAQYYSAKAVEIEPDKYLFHKNMAVTMRETKSFERSREQYLWCLKEKPGDPDLNFDLAYIDLYLRKLDEAWEYFEWRFKTNKMRFPDTFSIPKWNGEDLSGKHIIVIAEQGFGDTILMTRFLKTLSEQAKTVTFSCKDALKPIFQDLPVQFLNEHIPDQAAFDYHIAMMSIPHILEHDWLKWPKPCKFSVPESSKQKYNWIRQYGKKDSLKVGIVWSGSVTFAGNEKRAVGLERFLALSAQHPDIQFFGFQKGEREADYKTHGTGTIVPLGQSFENFGDTAAAVEEMDCIVMTDSSLVHLSGTLGTPVLDLLQHMPYWLYFPEDTTTPLYDSIRFLRQKEAGDWDFVFDTASKALSKLSEERNVHPLSRERVLMVMDDVLRDAGAPGT